MAAGLIGALTAAPEALRAITDIVGRFIPDPQQAAQMSLEMQKIVSEREAAAATAAAEIAKAQSDTNTAEAASPSMFVAGWRPFVGWICGVGLGYSILLQPLLAWVTGIVGASIGASIPVPPTPNGDVLSTVLVGMLGIAGLRSYDKVKGTAANDIAKK